MTIKLNLVESHQNRKSNYNEDKNKAKKISVYDMNIKAD